jgi:transcriptional regulator with XRE-family HTH domain
LTRRPPSDPKKARRSDGAEPRQKAGESKTPIEREHPSTAQGQPQGEERLCAAQQSIGSFLRATRTAQKLTQEQVASMTRSTPWRLSRAAISAIERGQNFPGMEAMLALSNVLYVDPKELIERARLSTAVAVDVTGLSLEQLDQRATQFFWAGDFRQALSVYDAMLEKLALETHHDREWIRRTVASLEIRRATALKRAGALLSAIATAERAISLSVDLPQIHVEAYIVLADLQCQRGHLPLAGDAAKRAIELSEKAGPRTRGWAWMVHAHVLFLSGEYEPAREAFLEARRYAKLAGDDQHLTHIEGDVGMCCLELGQVDEARKWVVQAVERARQQSQPALEASWLVELGKIAYRQDELGEAEGAADAALSIAMPREHRMTVFRAEWLRHRIVRRRRPEDPDRGRIEHLRKLYLDLDQHEGIEEVQDFKKSVIRASKAEHRNAP